MKRFRGRMGWLILGVLALLVVGAVTARRLRGMTVYVSHPGGFVAHKIGGAHDSDLQPVSFDRYERIIQRLIKGDLFDNLWVSREQSEDGGVVVSLAGGAVEMDVTFLAIKEADQWASFRQKMKSNGRVPFAEDRWNVGLGDDMESVTLQYRLKKDAQEVREAMDQALDALQPTSGTEVFVDAWRSKDGPAGSGIKVVAERDFISEVP